MAAERVSEVKAIFSDGVFCGDYTTQAEYDEHYADKHAVYQGITNFATCGEFTPGVLTTWMPSLLADGSSYFEGHFVFDGAPDAASRLVQHNCDTGCAPPV